ncbi:S8 family peptidase [Candidatus Peregrinibacteria bacterium]|nr:S8 family peptidase [Candidatus Peregrinibacteria bacterium]
MMGFLPAVSADESATDFADQAVVASEAVPGQYIVIFKENIGELGDIEEFIRQHKLSQKKELYERIKGMALTLDAAQVEALKLDSRVEVIEPDFVVYAFRHKSSPVVSVQSLPTGINRIEADASPTANINGSDNRVDVDVAVLDTGVQKSHPDLNVVQQVKYSTDASKDDLNGHGTHVAGIIGAKDNSAGVVGVAPGARIWSVKVLNRNGSGKMSDIIKGIDYVTAHANEIEVANMSLGCQCQSSALNAALDRSIDAGVVYAVAAGNSSADAQSFSPANHPKVITVSAIADFNGQPGGGASPTCRSDTDDSFANFSNYGYVVDIAAPGVCITSTWKGGKYATISGTSMASPHVAGAAALYIASHGNPSNASDVAAVRDALVNDGFEQDGANGFTEDPDSYSESLLNVGSY